jgi:signal transduction histidine kinase
MKSKISPGGTTEGSFPDEGSASSAPRVFSTKPLSSKSELNLRSLRPLCVFIEERLGADEFARVARSADLEMEDLNGKSNWSSLEKVERFLDEARQLFVNDEDFKAACTYKLKESFGAVGLLLQALSPLTVYKKGIEDHHLMSRISSNELVSFTRNSMTIRFTGSKPGSRLLCLLRQAQMAALPTIYGLPTANIEEKGCLAHGDDACVYSLQWYEASRQLPALIGLIGGAGIAAVLHMVGLSSIVSWLTIPAIGFLMGLTQELIRTNKVNFKIGGEINEAVRQLANEDSEARQEILELHERQRDWSRLMEEQVSERTERLERVLSQVKDYQEQQNVAMRGFSHDLKNPLTIMRLGNDFIREWSPEGNDFVLEIIDEIDLSISKMDEMIHKVMEITEHANDIAKLRPEPILVESAGSSLRRRLKALALGKDLRTTVLTNREAPETVVTDPLVFDRIIDNLLTNAIKYTERGSIVVELDGRPGFLTVKVSDTGRGIAHEQILRIFEPHGSTISSRAANSHGLGLSVVVKLLDQIGGKLEVMSKPHVGTTFWAHFPADVSQGGLYFQSPVDATTDQNKDMLSRVVTIRSVQDTPPTPEHTVA